MNLSICLRIKYPKILYLNNEFNLTINNNILIRLELYTYKFISIILKVKYLIVINIQY